MAIVSNNEARPRFLDKAEVRAILDRAYAKIGFVPVQGATAERAQQMMLDAGIRPEDNLLSRAIVEMREE